MKSPLELARERELRLAQGLRDLAAKHGKTFKEPLAIDSRGEFNLFIEPDPPQPGFPGACGQYGDALAALVMDTDRREKELRHLCNTWEKIPAGTFRSEGTNVPTILLSMTA